MNAASSWIHQTEALSATIRTTSYGVPHIKADNLKSLAFGWSRQSAEGPQEDLFRQGVIVCKLRHNAFEFVLGVGDGRADGWPADQSHHGPEL